MATGHPVPLAPLFSVVCVARMAWLATVPLSVGLSTQKHSYLWLTANRTLSPLQNYLVIIF